MRKLMGLAMAAGLLLGAQPAFAACTPLQQIGFIPLQKYGPVWLVPVGINGTPKSMYLDTGQGSSYITPETVAELKLPRRESPNALLVYADGTRSYAYTNIDRLALGTVGQFSKSDFTMDADLPGGAKRPATAPAGSIGLELLSHFDFDMDLKNGKLGLFKYDHCDGEVVYWADAAVAVPFEWNSQGRIRFKVKLDGTQLYAVLDTTDSVDTLNLTYYKSQTDFDENAAGVERLQDLGSGAKMYRTKFKSLDIGGLNVSNPTIALREDKLATLHLSAQSLGSNITNTDDKREPDLTIGVSTLAKLHVYVASKEKKLYISPAP